MKKNVIVLTVLFFVTKLKACPVCERSKPAVLKGVTHGSIPESRWDYLIVAGVTLIAMLVLFYSVKWMLFPGERSAFHIKRTILND